MEKDSSLTVLVTGAAGFIGNEFVGSLIDRNLSVVAVFRNRNIEFEGSVYPVCSDLKNADLLAVPLRGVDVVVHLAWNGTLGCKRGPQGSENLEALTNLLKAAEKHGTRRFIFVSACGGSPDSTSHFLKEKYDGELLVINSRIRQKIILRTAPVLGGGTRDRLISVLKRLLVLPGVYPAPRKGSSLTLIGMEEVVEILNRLITLDLKGQEIFLAECFGQNKVVIDDLIKFVCEKVYGKRKMGIPGLLGKYVRDFCERKESSVGLKGYLQNEAEILQAGSKGTRIECSGKAEQWNQGALGALAI